MPKDLLRLCSYWALSAGLVASTVAAVPALAHMKRPLPVHLSSSRHAGSHDRSGPAATRASVRPVSRRHAYVQVGVASWYGPHRQGRLTASGQVFDMRKMTAAHRTLPLMTRARVTNLENGKSVDVVINDRGPAIKSRVIDLSEGAAKKLGMKKQGLALVRVEALPPTAPVETTASSTAQMGDPAFD